jgi:hypothetical protein
MKRRNLICEFINATHHIQITVSNIYNIGRTFMEDSGAIPSDILPYLTPDEKLLKTTNTEVWQIYVTDKRILFKKGSILEKVIVEAAHRHISSIEYKKDSPLPSIIGGIILIALGWFANYFLNQLSLMNNSILIIGLAALLAIMGIALIISSLLKSPTLKIYVVGREPIIISGKLKEIFRIVREHQ